MSETDGLVNRSKRVIVDTVLNRKGPAGLGWLGPRTVFLQDFRILYGIKESEMITRSSC